MYKFGFLSSRKALCLEIMKKVGVIIFPGSGRNSEQSPTVKCGQFGLFELENSGSGHNQNMSILRTIVNKLVCTAVLIIYYPRNRVPTKNRGL